MLAASDFDALRVKAVIFDVDGTLADTERDGKHRKNSHHAIHDF